MMVQVAEARCPYCGALAEVRKRRGSWHARCPECQSAEGGFRSARAAIRAWQGIPVGRSASCEYSDGEWPPRGCD